MSCHHSAIQTPLGVHDKQSSAAGVQDLQSTFELSGKGWHQFQGASQMPYGTPAGLWTTIVYCAFDLMSLLLSSRIWLQRLLPGYGNMPHLTSVLARQPMLMWSKCTRLHKSSCQQLTKVAFQALLIQRADRARLLSGAASFQSTEPCRHHTVKMKPAARHSFLSASRGFWQGLTGSSEI